jgi:methylated-DNA-[protein]-cysteine S-methyltransferase
VLTRRYYVVLPSDLGHFGIVWTGSDDGVSVRRILLPGPRDRVESLARSVCGAAAGRAGASIGRLGEQIRSFLSGSPTDFRLDLLSLDLCSGFQRSVLLAEHAVPRGWVTTYGRMAAHLGAPGGARAVGGALARNPFPIVIPCHRVIRSDGSLGGFQGGAPMKQALLTSEGIHVSSDGRVLAERIYY